MADVFALAWLIPRCRSLAFAIVGLFTPAHSTSFRPGW